MPVAQTPVTWLDGGAAALWSAECVAALIACGIEPANFGTYDLRANAQRDARNEYRKRRIDEAKGQGPTPRPHEGFCPMGSNPEAECRCFESDNAHKDLGIEKWMLANSQSGHISQNAFYQGDRKDPCSNVAADGDHGGAYGYRDNKAFCMDHLGRSSTQGTNHYEITQREGQHEAELKSNNTQVVTESDIQQGAKGTASVAANGSEHRQKGNDPHAPYDKNLGNMTTERVDEAKRNDARKREYAAYLKAKYNNGQTAAEAGSGEAGTPNSPGSYTATDAEKDKAAECISDAWKQSLDDLRNDTINTFSTAARSKECKDEIKAYRKTLPPEDQNKKIRYTDLPADRRAKVDAAVKQKVETAQTDLIAEGADSAGKANNPPTKKDCMTYQANWLQQHRKADGSFPPMKGRVPDSGENQSVSVDAGQSADVV